MDLYDYLTGEYISPATAEQTALSDEADARGENGAFYDEETGRTCYTIQRLGT